MAYTPKPITPAEIAERNEWRKLAMDVRGQRDVSGGEYELNRAANVRYFAPVVL